MRPPSRRATPAATWAPARCHTITPLCRNQRFLTLWVSERHCTRKWCVQGTLSLCALPADDGLLAWLTPRTRLATIAADDPPKVACAAAAGAAVEISASAGLKTLASDSAACDCSYCFQPWIAAARCQRRPAFDRLEHVRSCLGVSRRGSSARAPRTTASARVSSVSTPVMSCISTSPA